MLLSAHPQGLDLDHAPECSSPECRGYEERPSLWVIGGEAMCLDCAYRVATETLWSRRLGWHITDREVDRALEIVVAFCVRAKATEWAS